MPYASSRAVLRFVLFSIVTAGGVLLGSLQGKTSEDFVKFGWVEWLMFWGPIVGAWLGTVIAFLDQTMGKLRETRDTTIWKA